MTSPRQPLRIAEEDYTFLQLAKQPTHSQATLRCFIDEQYIYRFILQLAPELK